MDVLTLSGLQFHAHHGYYEHERTDGNDFEVDLVFHADLSAAGQSDDLNQTIDYQKAERLVREIMHGPSVKLIETLVEKIGSSLFAEFNNLQKLEVRLRKLHPPLETSTAYAQITRTWTRS